MGDAKKKGYDFVEVEARIRKLWDDQKVYVFDAKQKSPYSVDTPPPTVSGAMHIGHAFSYAQQDFIARYRRMKQGVFYPFGTDDNGLPTERLVERLKGVKSKNMSRAEFISLCLETLKEITPDFVQDWKNLGVSADYSNVYSTIDDNSRKISQASFIELFSKGHVYKEGFPTLWCPECQTAIAQAELEDQEKVTNLVYVKAKLDDGRFIVYATTRPELHPGCIGISLKEDGLYVDAKHGDETWVVSKDAFEKLHEEFDLELQAEFEGKALVGKTVEIPFAKNVVTVSHDISAKTEYGTGVVYYCSYGGLDCVQWLTRHPSVEPIDIMSQQGVYTVDPVIDLKSLDARKKIISLLKENGSLVKLEKMSHVVNTHDKCGTDIEYIRAPQWFVRIMDKKDQLLAQADKIKWYPAHMKKRYTNWVEGLEWDWNVSRNRHFGIPIPMWYCSDCDELIPADMSELPVDPLQTKKVCSKCKKDAVPESMVLDTWATSSLSPQIATSSVNCAVKVPYSLRPQAHDIIRTWAFYTITRSFLSDKKIPWSDIVISGVVTRKGEKMSKSKGNGVDPKDVIAEYGSDALRFWAAGSKLGGDLDYQEQDLIAGKKTINKLINATKFVFMNLGEYDGKAKPKHLERIDFLFFQKLESLIEESTKYFEEHEYSKAKYAVERFFFGDFADNYLEIVKKRVYNGSGDRLASAHWTLYHTLLTILKLFAPFMPFVTEHLYQEYFRSTQKDSSIHISSWPVTDREIGTSNRFDIFKQILSQVREEKTANKKSMNSEIVLTIPEEYPFTRLEGVSQDLMDVTNAQEIREGPFKVEFVEE